MVANPPFSLKNWTQGFNPHEDLYDRFTGFGVPPEKNGDYAFLLHIVASLKSTGKGAVILPHGVLFRGNAEATIRRNLVQKGLIKGIIGLPANLFYGTGIPACILVIDKEDADRRSGIFMVDASKGFAKDGNKNRLREQDIHQIVDVFNKQLEIPRYSRLVPYAEIADPKNDFNLNLPRYIDSQEPEDIQDIAAHLLGGIPARDVDALAPYWEAYPTLKSALFVPGDRPGYYRPAVAKEDLKNTIFNHPDFRAFSAGLGELFRSWADQTAQELKALPKGFKPKETIHRIAERLLENYHGKPLVDKYEVYQHLMDFYHETMQDDLYQISEEGWSAVPYRLVEKNKKSGKETAKGWTCDLLPPALISERFFPSEKEALDQLDAAKEAVAAQLAELEEEHGGEEGLFADFEKVNKNTVAKRRKELGKHPEATEEAAVLDQYLTLADKLAALSAQAKAAAETLDQNTFARYAQLSPEEVRDLVVDHKWMAAIDASIQGELDRISQRLTGRVKELMERYETPLPAIDRELAVLEAKVNAHLQKMGFVWG